MGLRVRPSLWLRCRSAPVALPVGPHTLRGRRKVLSGQRQLRRALSWPLLLLRPGWLVLPLVWLPARLLPRTPLSSTPALRSIVALLHLILRRRSPLFRRCRDGRRHAAAIGESGFLEGAVLVVAALARVVVRRRPIAIPGVSSPAPPCPRARSTPSAWSASCP